MKYLRADTPGGRMRDIRYSQGKSLKEVARYLGVTGNYLGLVERGDRKPSQALLKEFAAKMEVSYDWLINGDATQDTATSSYQDEDYKVSADAINAKLFLPIILLHTKVTRDTLVDILTVSSDTVDEMVGAITKIKGVDIDPNWAEIFSALAQQSDISALRRDLHDIDLFLKCEELKKNRRDVQKLLAMLKKEEKYAKMFEGAKTELLDWQASNEISLPTNLCVPVSVKDIAEDEISLYLHCYPYLTDIDADTARGIYDFAAAAALKIGYEVSVILKCSAARDAFHTLNKKIAEQEAEDAQLGYWSAKPAVTVIYYDDTTDSWNDFRMFDPDH